MNLTAITLKARSAVDYVVPAKGQGECRVLSRLPVGQQTAQPAPFAGNAGNFQIGRKIQALYAAGSAGGKNVDGSPLSGGVGQLTDGYVAAAPYTVDMGRGNAYEWVGWVNIQPSITFDFASEQTFHNIAIHSHNQLDVPLWTSVILDFSNDGVNFGNAVTYTTSLADHANTAARFINATIPNTAGRYVRARFTHAGYMMISEVQFQ